MGELADIAKSRTPYLTILPDELVVAIYKGFKMIPDTYNPESEKYRFIFDVNGENKYIDTGSNKLALTLDRIEAGSKVRIAKYQSGVKDGKPRYSWTIEEVVDSEGKVSKKEKKAIEDEMAG